jgi:dihydrofolate synthase/folylpolyglutamate synthase
MTKMNYQEALNYFHSVPKFTKKDNLNTIETLLKYLSDPQKKLKVVHVAGTNGKGSTVAYISKILMEAGYRVGVYTSPFLQRFTERVKINDQEISEAEVGQLAARIKTAVNDMQAYQEGMPTEFDLITVMAFLYFAECGCDIVVLEVGLGGRLDSTNIIDIPEAAVITTISYDHMEVLGNTLAKIAYEKAGIIKNGCEVVLYPQEPEVEAVMKEVCDDKKALLHAVDLSELKLISYGPSGQSFDLGQYKRLEIHLLGDYQLQNAATAVRTIEVLNSRGFHIKEDQIRKGLKNTRWAGRLEIIRNNPLLLIDGAHNTQGVSSLKDCLIKYFPGKSFTFIIGVLADKEYSEMMDMIEPLAKRFITITPPSPRALPSKELAAFLGQYGKEIISFDKVEEALDYCGSFGPEELICAFGSLYYIGIIRDYYGLD